MEEDIKRIETLIEGFRKAEFAGLDDIEDLYQKLTYKDYKAIKNLIARYKELEEGKALTKRQEAMILKAIKQSAEEQITKEMKNYIPKSKVQEKIEELKKEKKAPITIQWEMEDMIEAKIQVLQELIEN